MKVVHKVDLTNEDLNDAIKLYLQENGVDTFGKSLKINITAGRKGVGSYANVTIEPSEEKPTLPVAGLALDVKPNPNLEPVEEVKPEPVIEEEEEEEVLDAVTQSTDPISEITDEDDEDETTSLFS